MAGHNSHNSCIDQFFIYFSKCSIPLITVVFIDAHDQMLVIFLCTVSREVFHTGGDILCFHSFEEGFCIADNILRIVVKSS